MDTGTADRKNRRFNLKTIFENIKNRFRKKQLTVDEVYTDLQGYTKNQLRRELVAQAQLNNQNRCGVAPEFHREIKKYSKKQIIKAIILLRIKNDKTYKKIFKNKEFD